MVSSLPKFDLTIVKISLGDIIKNATTLKVHTAAKEIRQIFSPPTIQPQTSLQ
jgi:hypothetical protein